MSRTPEINRRLKVIHYLRKRKPLRTFLRKTWFRFCGMEIRPGTDIGRINIEWPHLLSCRGCFIDHGCTFVMTVESAQRPAVIIESGTYIGRHCEFNAGSRISIGPRCMIASGCKFIDHDHLIQPVGTPLFERGPVAPIVIGDNVWLGNNVIVLKGIHIGDGAIVGAGAVVTKSIPPNEIWAGVPARKIAERPGNPSNYQQPTQ